MSEAYARYLELEKQISYLDSDEMNEPIYSEMDKVWYALEPEEQLQINIRIRNSRFNSSIKYMTPEERLHEEISGSCQISELIGQLYSIWYKHGNIRIVLNFEDQIFPLDFNGRPILETKEGLKYLEAG